MSSGNDNDILSQNISYLLCKEADQATTSIVIFLPSPLFHPFVQMYVSTVNHLGAIFPIFTNYIYKTA